MSKTSTIFTALPLVVSLSAHGQTPAAPEVVHPIVGKWQWTRGTNKCTETYDYRSDGNLFIASGAEETNVAYTISDQPDAKGFFELKGRPVKSNGAPDCSDSKSNGDGAPYTVYIIFNKEQPLHLVCKTPAIDQCFGPLERVKP